MEMIQPNKLKQAQAELQTIKFNNGFEIPTEIKEEGADKHYIFIGVKARDTQDGFSKLYIGKKLVASMNQYNKMRRMIEKGLYKTAFAGIYDKAIMLHDPTFKAPKEEKVKDLSPKQKGEVNKLKEEGKTLEEISTITGYDVKRIKAYLNA